MNHAAFLPRVYWLAWALLPALHLAAQDDQADWPLSFTADGNQVQVFKPQPESFDGSSFTARAAVSIQRPQDSSPVFGAAWGSGTLAIDRTNRMGTLTAFNVTDVRLPGITGEGERERIARMLSSGILKNARPIAIDWLVAALEDEHESSEAYDNSPPEIIYREKPGLLLFIDGQPIMEPVKNAGNTTDPVYAANAPEVERVVNTPFFVVRPKGGAYWLYGSGLWYNANNINGPWVSQKKAPANLEKLAAAVDSSYQVEQPQGVVPGVVVSLKPAVLLDLDGPPQMQPLENSSLMYATNTDKDLFLYIPTQEYYFLASGRWYATTDLRNGPWHYVASDALPADFARIPEGSAKDGVLAHIAGTDAAREAVRDAQIPQTAKVDRKTATVQVTYDGSPQFERIAGTEVYSAVNASTVVLRINGRYYVVDNAVWFEGDSPDGPWMVSTAVPSEVNTIPPSDPNYRVRYVYIYDYTPDWVFIGYTPGYIGAFVQGGVVIYGTGHYYNPWRHTYWYPRPYTWGFNMYYNPWYGWGFGASWGYNWFYPGWFSYYRPYSWGWWGPYAYCPPIATWYGHGHYWHGHYWPGTGRGGSWYYGHRPSMSSSNRPSRMAPGGGGMRPSDLYRNRPTAGVTPSVSNGRPTIAATARDRNLAGKTPDVGMKKPAVRDYFTDRQGNVYRNQDGATEKWQDGKWDQVARPKEERPAHGKVNEGAARPGGTTTDRPAGRPAAPSVTRPPQREPSWRMPDNPGNIQRERERGDKRVNDYRGYQQQQWQAPRAPRNEGTTPRISTPQVRPSAPPMRSAPSTPSPSRGTGGGRRTR